MEFPARYYDGKSTQFTEVQVEVDSGGWLTIRGLQGSTCQFKELTVKPRVANTARYLYLPDGARLETLANDTVDELCDLWKNKIQGIPHFLESNTPVFLSCLAGLIILGYMFVAFGIPALSKQITDAIPVSVDHVLGEEVQALLDRSLFSESTLSKKRQLEISNVFDGLVPEDSDYTLLFRNGGMVGANALALPNQTVIMTDQLVSLAQNNEELAGILLHEVAHICHRHSMQNLVRQSGLAMLITVYTGDLTFSSSLAVVLPTVLLQSSYSQEFEWEADSYALEQMLDRGINTQAFASIMVRLTEAMEDRKRDGDGKDTEVDSNEKTEADGEEEDIEVDQVGDDPTWLDYISTHPPTRERIERFMDFSE